MFSFNWIKYFRILQFSTCFIFILFIWFYLKFTKEVEENQYSFNISNEKLCHLNNKILVTIKPDLNSNKAIVDIEKSKWAENVTEGKWTPPNCLSVQKVAIIIPYREREEHLKILINHIHPFLQKQLLAYGIFVIEQAPGKTFNKAALFNVGFQEAISMNFTCFIFHDVDLLPTDLKNLYKCTYNPLHLSVAVDKFHYKLPYLDILGGVVAMTKNQFLKINGFSNLYFGWGSEDDDLSLRVQQAGYKIVRKAASISRFIMLKHQNDVGNQRNKNMNKLYFYAKQRYKEEGFNTLQYILISNQSDTSLYRKITVQFSEEEIMKKWNKLYKLEK